MKKIIILSTILLLSIHPIKTLELNEQEDTISDRVKQRRRRREQATQELNQYFRNISQGELPNDQKLQEILEKNQI